MPDLPAARWAADPYGRHEMRYWDGVAWTAHVSDAGVTGSDMVPGVAAGQAAAADTTLLDAPAGQDQTVVMPIGSTAPPLLTGAAGAVASGATVPGAGLPPAPGGPGVDAFFGSSTVSAKSAAPVYRTPPANKPRTGLVVGVACLGIVGVIAGVIGFSGLPDGGKKGGSDAVVPVAAPPTSSAATDEATDPTTTDEPVATDSTTYGGPTTSPVARTTTKVRTTTTTPRTTTTSTTPTVTRTKPTPTLTPPTSTRPGLRQYPSCPAMHVDHPHGVGRPGARDRTQGPGPRVRDFEVNAPLYFINAGLDFDGDGIACEA